MASPSRVRRYGRPGSPDHRVEFLPGRARLLLTGVGGLVLAVACVLLLVAGAAGVSPTRWVALVAGVPLGLAGVLFGGRRLVSSRPLLVLDGRGLHDDASAIGVGFVPWSDVVGISALSVGRQRMLGVDVADRDALLARLSPVRRRLVERNLRTGGTPVVIPQAIMPVPVEELHAEIEAFRVAP